MAEILDLNDEGIRETCSAGSRRGESNTMPNDTRSLSGTGVLRGFTDEQLLDELDRRHPPAGSGSERWGTDSWPETKGQGLTDDTSKGGQIPTQAEADAVAAQAAAEEAERKAEATQ